MSIRFIARDGSEHMVQDDAQFLEAIKRGEVVRETLVYDDTKQAWIKAGERFREIWGQRSPGNSASILFRRYALWVAYPAVILLYVIVTVELHLDDRAATLAGQATSMFFMALLVVKAISGRWSEPVKQRLWYVAFLVFVSGYVAMTLVMYKQKMDEKQDQRELVSTAKELVNIGTKREPGADGGVAGTTGSADAPPVVEPQLSKAEVIKRINDLLKQRVVDEKKIAAEAKTLELDRLFAPQNFAVPNAIERNRKTIQRYQELILRSGDVMETYRNEYERLVREQAVLASGRDTYEKTMKESVELEMDLIGNLLLQADAMSRFNEFLSEHLNHIVLDSEEMRFDSPEVEGQARMLAEEMAKYAEQIGQLMKKIEQRNKAALQKLES